MVNKQTQDIIGLIFKMDYLTQNVNCTYEYLMLKNIFVSWFSSHIQGYNEGIILLEQMSLLG